MEKQRLTIDKGGLEVVDEEEDEVDEMDNRDNNEEAINNGDDADGLVGASCERDKLQVC